MFCHHWVDTSTGRLLVPNDISVSVYVLDIFIVEIYSFYLNNVIFIKKIRIYSFRLRWPYQIFCHLFRPSFAPKHLIFSVIDDGYYRNASCALKLIFTLYCTPVVISIKLLQKYARFLSNGRGVCGSGKRGDYLRQNWVHWHNWSLKNNPHSYISSA